MPTEGSGGFDAYSIISFSHTDKVLLECPIYGNAAYVMRRRGSLAGDDQAGACRVGPRPKKIPHRGDDCTKKVRRALDLE